MQPQGWGPEQKSLDGHHVGQSCCTRVLSSLEFCHRLFLRFYVEQRLQKRWLKFVLQCRLVLRLWYNTVFYSSLDAYSTTYYRPVLLWDGPEILTPRLWGTKAPARRQQVLLRPCQSRPAKVNYAHARRKARGVRTEIRRYRWFIKRLLSTSRGQRAYEQVNPSFAPPN